MPYLTGDTIPLTRKCRTIRIPGDPAFLAAFYGAILELSYVYNWEKFGTLTPEQMAAAWFDIYGEMDSEVCMEIPVGTVTMHAGVVVPAKWRRCEGQSLVRATFPDLFNAIGVIYGAVDSTHFNLPDFRDRSAIGWNAAATNQGIPAGAMTHAISLTEMPIHHHAENNGASAAFLATGGTGRVGFGAVTTSNTTPVNTADTGSGTPMSLLHPVLPMQFLIYAGV